MGGTFLVFLKIFFALVCQACLAVHFLRLLRSELTLFMGSSLLLESNLASNERLVGTSLLIFTLLTESRGALAGSEHTALTAFCCSC